MITLYDFPSASKGNGWNLNVWKARFTLNYKGIPYQSTWVEYPDVEKLAKEIGAEPTGKKDDGSPMYTLPIIRDDSTGTVVSDSFRIALYLDKAYPDKPKVIPTGTQAFTAAFIDAFESKQGALWQFLLPQINWALNPSSEAYFRSSREAKFGITLEALFPQGAKKAEEWKKVEEGWGIVAEWLGANTFVMGDTPCFADFAIAGALMNIKIVFGDNSEEWKRILQWQGGKWSTFIKNLEKYTTIV